MVPDDTVAVVQLLVSVDTAADAAAAIAGGADIVDAKDPRAGALGAVSLETLRAIREIVAGRRPLTAAIDDARDEAAVERTAFAFAAEGARFVKIGFGGVRSEPRVVSLAAAAQRGAAAATGGRSAAVLVVYAYGASASARDALVDVAARVGARGVLLDTADKDGPPLPALVCQRTLAAWTKRAHDCGLLVALAGKLRADDLAFVRDAGADIAGVRGAACEGGRTGIVSVDRVRSLKAVISSLNAQVSTLKY